MYFIPAAAPGAPKGPFDYCWNRISDRGQRGYRLASSVGLAASDLVNWNSKRAVSPLFGDSYSNLLQLIVTIRLIARYCKCCRVISVLLEACLHSVKDENL